MTIKRCVICGKGFSTKKSKLDIFCSIKCKLNFEDKELETDDKWREKQFKMDLKAKRKTQEDDFRLPRRGNKI